MWASHEKERISERGTESPSPLVGPKREGTHSWQGYEAAGWGVATAGLCFHSQPFTPPVLQTHLFILSRPTLVPVREKLASRRAGVYARMRGNKGTWMSGKDYVGGMFSLLGYGVLPQHSLSRNCSKRDLQSCGMETQLLLQKTWGDLWPCDLQPVDLRQLISHGSSSLCPFAIALWKLRR